jgi:molecular chaperone GrpE
VVRESALALQRGAVKLAKELLPALDNLDRALDEAGTAAGGGGQDDPLLQGVRLVRSELTEALARVGVESFSPVGEIFDPVLHEAVVHQPVQGAASGTVAEVYQPGYRLGEQIIRPARVVVAA